MVCGDQLGEGREGGSEGEERREVMGVYGLVGSSEDG